jgi:cell division protein FtsZ
VIELDTMAPNGAKINNALNSMIGKGLIGVDFVAINTDLQQLSRNNSPMKVQIGKNLTKGLGSGADPTVGQRAVEEDREEIARVLSGSDMVFITAGMGGGTGTGGAPVVANIAKNLGALVVGIVTKPFLSEGKKRMAYADDGIVELKKNVDTLIVIPNQRLLSVIEHRTTIIEAFEICNKVLYNAARGIADLITVPGFINVDFADVRKIMREMGDALMGIGVSKGEHRATEAATSAISHPLLEGISIAGAQGVLVNITGGPSLALMEVNEATDVIYNAAGEEAEVILGTVIDDKLDDEIFVTVIATGFGKKKALQQPAVRPATKLFDRVSGPIDIQKLDEPAYIRKGIDIKMKSIKPEQEEHPSYQPDVEKPAFLRKIMD